MQGLFIILGSVALNQFNQIVVPIFWFFLSFIGRISFISSASAGAKIDDELMKYGYVSVRHTAVHEKPAKGIHLLFCNYVPIVLYKDSEYNPAQGQYISVFTVIMPSAACFAYISNLVDSSPANNNSENKSTKASSGGGGIKLRLAYPVSGFYAKVDDIVTPDPSVPTKQFKWQDELYKTIMIPLPASMIRRVPSYTGVLISGPSGTGKSTFCYWIARQLREQHQLDATVVLLTLTCPGISLPNMILQPTAERPVILDISEFDVSAAYAMSGQEMSSKCYTLARNKTTLMETLDRIRDTPHVYAIFSMNTPLEEFETEYPFCSQVGRITHKFAI